MSVWLCPVNKVMGPQSGGQRPQRTVKWRRFRADTFTVNDADQ